MGAVHGVARRVAAHWPGNSGASAQDMAIPLGRNHPPPEVLFQQGAQNGWMPDPDSPELPEANDLYSVVCEFMRKLIVQASPGFYCIVAPFIKYAEKEVPAVHGRGVGKMNVLALYFARFFALMMGKAQIPEMWKAAKVTPLYKIGIVLDPNNYRMLAVSGIMYRLYVNVQRVYLTEWCQKNNKIPDTQFGFYPGRNALQPMFILRHLLHAAQTRKPHGSPRLHAAFIDFKQVYDSIPTVAFWEHLQCNCMPTSLLKIIQNLYDADEYLLVEGFKQARVRPTRGVKQGCPLSPLLLSLYINDVDCIARDVRGAVKGVADVRVTHMLYADDLSLTANEPDQLQMMLDRLSAYALRRD